MKKFMVVLLAICCVSSLHAQWSITPEAGIAAVNRASTEEWKPSVTFGVGLEYELSNRFSLQSGLYYTKRSYSFYSAFYDPTQAGTIDPEVWYGKVERNRGYLQMPVMGKLAWDMGDDIRFNVAAGPYLAYRIQTAGSVGLTNNGYYSPYGYGYGYDYGYGSGYGYGGLYGYNSSGLISDGNKFDWGASLAVGLEVKNWVMNVSYNLSLSKEDDWDKVSANFHTISLSVGYKFRL